jgi:hypothetical protein
LLREVAEAITQGVNCDSGGVGIGGQLSEGRTRFLELTDSFYSKPPKS